MMRNRAKPTPHSLAGVTLIELMVAVAIVGVLAAIAYPSYARYTVRANRTVAKGLLLQVADRQEQYFADHKAYASNLTQLGFSANPFMVNNQGTTVGTTSSDRIYRISLSNTAATTFTANAAPQLAQSTRDTACGTMTLTHRGLKGQTGSATNCW